MQTRRMMGRLAAVRNVVVLKNTKMILVYIEINA